jgi:methionine synthase II (cobalamin-independent)
MIPPFRAEHIGSLMRPAAFLAKRDAESTALYDEDVSEELKAETQIAITKVVQQQLDRGVRPLTTGEFERERFYSGFWEKLGGFSVVDLPVPDGFRTGMPSVVFVHRAGFKSQRAIIATGKIRRTQPVLMEGWAYLQHAVAPDHWKDCKITIPAPTWQQMQLPAGKAYSPGVYDSDREYFEDLAEAYRQEIQDLYDAGLRHIQLDAPNLTFFVVDDFREAMRNDGVDPDELLDLHIWAINECLRGLPEDLRVGIHLCRGNMPGSRGVLSGSYEPIAEKVLKGLNLQTFYLEFDDERSGGFEPLRFLPVGKHVVLGLVSTKRPKLESLDVLEDRVRQAADTIAKGQGRTSEQVLQDSLAVSSQCGYSSMQVAGSIMVSESKMWAKLELVRDLSREIWKDAV